MSDAGSGAGGFSAESGERVVLEGYQLEHPIGVGGMGAVWAGVQLSTHRKVAVKLLYGSVFGSSRGRRRFETEIECAARLEHPNIIRVYDSGIHQGLYFYAMERVHGLHLDQYVHAHGLTQAAMFALLSKVCRAVDYAHRHGVIHRDLKPANILVTDDGEPHVVDFGLAKLIQESATDHALTISGEAVGTLAYMAPEQVLGQNELIDSRCDVYALGVMLYQLLVGRLPHDHTGPRYEVQRRIAEDALARPQALRRTIDVDLEAILLKALAHDPSQRYTTPGELAEDIENYLRGDPLRALPLTAAYFLRKRLQKHRRRVALVLLLACLLFAGAAGSYIQIVHERNAARASAAAANQALYANRIVRTGTELERHNVAAAKRELELCPPSLRGWEWHRLRYHADQSTVTLAGHQAWTEHLAFDPETGRLISIDERGWLKVWDTATHETLYAFHLFENEAEAHPVALAANGGLVATAGESAITLMTPHGDRVGSIPTSEPVHLLALSPNGQWLGAGTGETVRAWRVGESQPVLTASAAAPVQQLALGDDGAIFATAGRSVIRLDAHNASRRWEHALDGIVTVIAIDPVQRQLALAGRDRVTLYEMDSGQPTQHLPSETARTWAIRFSSDGTELFSVQGNLLHRWETASGRLMATYRGHTHPIRTLAANGRDGGIATGGHDGLIKLWHRNRDIQGIEYVQSGTTKNAVISWDLAETGAMAVAIRQQELLVRSNQEEEWRKVPTAEYGSVDVVALRPDGKQLAIAAGTTVLVWALPDLSPVAVFEVASRPVRDLTWCRRTGRLAAVGAHADQAVTVFDPGAERVVKRLEGGRHAAFNGSALMTVAPETAELLVWDTATWALRQRIATGPGTVVAMETARTQPLAATITDTNTINIWNLETGVRQASFQSDNPITSQLVFISDADRLVAVGEVLEVWDLATSTVLLKLVSPEGKPFQHAAICSRTDRLVASTETTVLAWLIDDDRP
ncbi:MAG: serine/threonine-protein kinase [Phycisphaeraceae bacterium]